MPISVLPLPLFLLDFITTGNASGSGGTSGIAEAGYLATGDAQGSGDANGSIGADFLVVGTATGQSVTEAITPVVTPVDTTVGVQYWQGFPGPAGYIDIPNWSLFPVNVSVSQLNLRDTVGYAYLLKAVVPDSSNLLVESYLTFYPAASMGRSSAPDDTPSNTYVPGALLGSTINYSINLFDGIEPEAAASGGQGAIVLVDPKGELDYLASLPWDGAKLDILQGRVTAKYNTYSTVGRLTTAGILYDPRRKEFRLRDQADRLQKAGLHDQKYNGDGQDGGVLELQGVDKPYGIGSVFNVTPTCVNPNQQIWQMSCSSIQQVRVVKDGANPILATGIDYPDYAALRAAADASAIPLNRYSTCLARGMIALGSIPQLGLTVDFDGDADIINGTGYVDTLAGIVRRIATGRGDVKFMDDELDYPSLNLLSQVQPDVCGYWWPGGTQPTKAEALKEIMDGRLGWWAVRLNGLLSFGIMDEPLQSPVMTLNYPEDFAGEPQQFDTYQVPRKETFVGYQRNYTVQDASQLAGVAVDAGAKLVYSQPTLYAPSGTSFPTWLWPTAQVVKVDGGFRDHDPALFEALRQQGVMGVRRERWDIPVPCSAFADVLGKIIQINNYPRFGWGSSRKFVCIGVSFASGIAVTLTLWG